MTYRKFDYSYEESERLAALADERGDFGDSQSIGGYAQALKRSAATQALVDAGHSPRKIPHEHHAPGAIECAVCRLRARLHEGRVEWQQGQGGSDYYRGEMPACDRRTT